MASFALEKSSDCFGLAVQAEALFDSRGMKRNPNYALAWRITFQAAPDFSGDERD